MNRKHASALALAFLLLPGCAEDPPDVATSASTVLATPCDAESFRGAYAVAPLVFEGEDGLCQQQAALETVTAGAGGDRTLTIMPEGGGAGILQIVEHVGATADDALFALNPGTCSMKYRLNVEAVSPPGSPHSSTWKFTTEKTVSRSAAGPMFEVRKTFDKSPAEPGLPCSIRARAALTTL